MYRSLKRGLAAALVVSLGFMGFAQSAQATLISTEQVAREQAASPDRDRIAAALSRPDVVAQMQRLGVDPLQARERVDALTDDEAARLASALDSAPAGGDVLGVIVFVFLVLLVTDILGFTKIFPFTRSVR